MWYVSPPSTDREFGKFLIKNFTYKYTFSTFSYYNSETMKLSLKKKKAYVKMV